MANRKMPSAYRRNVAAFLADIGGFGAGIGFIHPVTVMPVLVRQLTSSALVVGLMTTVWIGGFLLPQLWAGRWLSDKPRKLPYVVWFINIGRLGLLVPALLCALVSPSNANVLLIGLFAGIIIFRVTDAIASVGWYDILSRAIPANRRGRVLGAGQILAGLGAMVSALVVRWALGTVGPEFPRNFALLFGLTMIGMAISSIAIMSLVEPEDSAGTQPSPKDDFIAHASHILRTDRAFRTLITVRLLSGLTGLAVPFYVVHATRELSLPVTFVGLAVAAQNISTIVSSLGWGTLAERATSRRVIQASTLAACLAPLGALVLHSLYTGNNLPSQLLGAGYLLVFAVLSAVDNSILLGYLNYVMEIAPPGQRTAYMGLTNTISGLLVTLPVAGGALLQVTSYPVLFAVAAMGAGIGFAVSLRLPRLGKE